MTWVLIKGRAGDFGNPNTWTYVYARTGEKCPVDSDRCYQWWNTHTHRFTVCFCGGVE